MQGRKSESQETPLSKVEIFKPLLRKGLNKANIYRSETKKKSAKIITRLIPAERKFLDGY